MPKPFVNMDTEKSQFESITRNHCILMLIEGESGTGKSTLISQFKEIAQQEKIPTSLVNFRETSYSPIDIIYSMASLIGRDACLNLQAAVVDFAESSNIIVKDNRAMFGAKLTINISSELNQRSSYDQNTWYRYITSAFFEDLNNSQIERVVLFLDTYEQVDETVSAWISTHLLPLLNSQRKLRIVISGQVVVGLDVEWEDLYLKITLAGLELHYWFKYLELLPITEINPDWVIALYRVFDGKPAAMITSIEKLLKESLSPDSTDEEKYWTLLNAYLQQFDNNERIFVIALSIFHWFDVDIANNLWNNLGYDDSYLKAWTLVTSLPFVDSSSRGFVFHELYRNALLLHLWRDKNELFREITNIAIHYFESEDPFLNIEKIYHFLVNNPSAGRNAFDDLVKKLQDSGLFSAWYTLNQYGFEHIRYNRIDHHSAALIWESAGQYSGIHGNYKNAINQLQAAELLYRQVDNKERLLGVIYSKAAFHSHIGQAEDGKEALRSAYSLALILDNSLYAGHVMYRIAEATNFGGEPKSSYSQYQKSLEWFEKSGDYAMQARNIMFMAETSETIEDKKKLYQDAVPLFTKGWIRYEKMLPNDSGFSPVTFIGGFSSKTKVKSFSLLNVAIDEGDCLQSIGDLEEQKDKKIEFYKKVLHSYQRALPLAESMKDLRWSARAKLRVGDILVKLGQINDAPKFFQQAQRDASRVEHKLYVGWALVGMGNLARLAGNKAEARNYYLQAQELYVEIGAYANIGWQIKPNLELLDSKTE